MVHKIVSDSYNVVRIKIKHNIMNVGIIIYHHMFNADHTNRTMEQLGSYYYLPESKDSRAPGVVRMRVGPPA